MCCWACVLFGVFLLAVGSVGQSNNWFDKGLMFDNIKFPTEFQQSHFNVRLQEVDRHQIERATDSLFGVAVRLKSLLDFNTNGGNFLVSPLSVAVALGQLILGARGESRRRIGEVLSTVRRSNAPAFMPDLEYHQQFRTLLNLLETSGGGQDDNYELQVASAFFIQPDLILRPDYKHAVQDLYNCDVLPLNFSGNPELAQATVNDWVTLHTHGHITRVLSNPLPPNTASLIANAIYFRGAWENPFDPELSITGTFKMGPTARVAVRYMRGQFDLNYAESDRLGCQMIVLPYKKEQAAMHIFLPYDKNYDIKNFTAALSINDMIELKKSVQLYSITLVMPRMSLTGSFSLKEPLARFDKARNKGYASTARAPPRGAAWRPRVKREEASSSSTTERQQKLVTPNITTAVPPIAPDGKETYMRNTNTSKLNVGLFSPRQGEFDPISFPLPLGVNGMTSFNYNTNSQQVYRKTEKETSSQHPLTDILNPLSVNRPYNSKERISFPSVENETEIYYPTRGTTDKAVYPPQTGPSFQRVPSASGAAKVPQPNTLQEQPQRVTSASERLSTSTPVSQTYPPSIPEQPTSQPSVPILYQPYYTSADQSSMSTTAQLYSTPTPRPSLSTGTQQHPTSTTQPPIPTKITENPTSSAALPVQPVPLNPLSASSSSFNPRPPQSQGNDGPIQFDLTGASEDSRFRIDDILHQMWIEVTETGTEAAAVSVGAVDYSGDVKLVLIDRPFLFVILHEVTRAALFWGAIVDPTGGAGIRTEDPLGRPTPSKQSNIVRVR